MISLPRGAFKTLAASMDPDEHEQMPVLEKRRSQAQVIKPIWKELVRQLRAEQARDILDRAIREAAIEG